jgi:hypothetical protein
MNKNSKDNAIKEVPKEAQSNTKLAVFEEDDYFEEFDDEEWGEIQDKKENIDFNKWQEEWEDEETNDQFENILRKEMDNFKAKA